MEQELISKKELLELTDISYGQLYRWKRERLIPEDWFIKRSSFTGQETFFPRTQALERVNVIKELKGDLSLEAIADLLSPKGKAIAVRDLEDILDIDSEYLELVFASRADSPVTASFCAKSDAAKSNTAKSDAAKSDTAVAGQLSFSEVVFIGALGALVKDGILTSAVAAKLAVDSRELAQQWINEAMHCDVLAVSDATVSDAAESDATESRPSLSWHLVLFKEGSPPLFSQGINIRAQLALKKTSATIKHTLLERTNNN